MKELKTYKQFVNESFLDKVPFIKDIRAQNRAKKEVQAKKDAEYKQSLSDYAFDHIKKAYFDIEKKIKGNKKWSKEGKADLLEELNQQVWGLLAPGGDYGDAPKNPKWQWDRWKKEGDHAYPGWAMNDIMEGLYWIIKKG